MRRYSNNVKEMEAELKSRTKKRVSIDESQSVS